MLSLPRIVRRFPGSADHRVERLAPKSLEGEADIGSSSSSLVSLV